MSWTIVEFPVDDSVSEIAAERLRAEGADGVAEEWRQNQQYVRAFWKDAPEGQVRAITDRSLHALHEAGLLISVPDYTVSSMDDQDWLQGWKQYFHPIAISPRLAVAPSWEAYDAPAGQQVIVLDPGMAFGTGTHGTTYSCLQALSDYLQAGMRVCDVGTGSGILAIGAVKLGAARVAATDSDELAIRVARENASVNAVSEGIDFRVADLLEGVDGPFDLLLANILAPVIVQLIPQLPGRLESGGIFISSGYITAQEAEIRRALDDAGHVLLHRYEREDWLALVSRAG